MESGADLKLALPTAILVPFLDVTGRQAKICTEAEEFVDVMIEKERSFILLLFLFLLTNASEEED